MESYQTVRGEITDSITKRKLFAGPVPQWELVRLDCAGMALTESDWQTLSSSGVILEEGPVLMDVLDHPDVQRVAEAVRGRSLLRDELLDLLTAEGLEEAKRHWASVLQTAYLREWIRLRGGVVLEERKTWRGAQAEYRCSRCGSAGKELYWADCLFCGEPCPYCQQCLTMGRARYCSVLVEGMGNIDQPCFGMPSGDGGVSGKAMGEMAATVELVELPPARGLERWGLSPAQTEASKAGLDFLERTSPGSCTGAEEVLSGSLRRFLIWAVTGAGKTEMIFPLIEQERKKGRAVLIATPRRDVVLELLPRLRKAFPNQRVAALYGGSGDRWARGDITIATTHQLLRFSGHFDLAIIDEIDAFPYHNNPVLHFAAEKSLKPTGRSILLSATPPRDLQKAARSRTLPHVKVPVRFHRHPLPVPGRIRTKPMIHYLESGQLPKPLMSAISRSLTRGAQLFLFVPKIKWVDPLVELLRRQYPDRTIEGTSSKDESRTEKVADFRQTNIDILVTTTILERGVTVPKTDVFVLDADSSLFDSSALVQMAGRAGRSKDDPNGFVYFAASAFTKSQAEAIRQIRQMNAHARRKGFLLPPEKKEPPRL